MCHHVEPQLRSSCVPQLFSARSAHTSGVPVAPSVALVRVGAILTRTPFVAVLGLKPRDAVG